jgi:hypothetical protein
MAQRNQSRVKTVTRRYRRDIGGAWWMGLVVVTVLLGLLGRGESGFWSVFLWSVVGFVLGSLAAMGLAGRLVPDRSEDEAFAGVGAVGGVGVEQ